MAWFGGLCPRVLFVARWVWLFCLFCSAYFWAAHSIARIGGLNCVSVPYLLICLVICLVAWCLGFVCLCSAAWASVMFVVC